ncbi:MAG: MFS transporter [Sulfobacillus benefaciens]|uniref:MFS transporter n=1 Tax=Sulfobacillus benefaciens TaxID=453960 RepID=A0A2T2XI50_9FIRM|nr:MAG: MFS transporter [Sulfobacillus benefaciens]
MWSALRSRGFLWLWMGQMFSQLGNAIFLIMGLWEIQLHSPFLLSLAGLGMSIPSMLAMAGGVFVDRYHPGKLMLGTDALRGIAVLVGLGVIWVEPQWRIWVIIMVLTINALGGALFGPAEMVVLPRLVSGQELGSANGLNAVTNQLSMAVGSAIGGAAIALIGMKVIFAFDMVSFWVSATAILLMLPHMRVAPSATLPPEHSSPGLGFWPSLRDGWAGLQSMPWFMALLLPVVLTNFAFNGAFTMFPYWMHHVLHAGPLTYGVVDAAWSAGLVLGSLVTGLVRPRSLRVTVGYLGIAMGGSILGFVFAHQDLVAGSMLFAAGIANGMINALFITFMQRIIPQHLMGRVMGIIITLFGLATPLGALAAGATLHLLPLSWMWLLSAGAEIPLAYVIFTKVPDDPGSPSGIKPASV